MNLDLPYLGHEGDLAVTVNPGKGSPWATIYLNEDSSVSLQWLTEGDCDQLIKAAADAKQQVLDARAKAAAPHKPWMSIPDTGCLHCGKPEADELHAEPACPSVAEHSGRQCTEPGAHAVHRNGRIVWGPGVTEPAGEGGVLFGPFDDTDEDGPMDDDAELRRADAAVCGFKWTGGSPAREHTCTRPPHGNAGPGHAEGPVPLAQSDADATAVLAESIATGTPVLVTEDGGFCPAFTGPDDELDVTLYCDRQAGHDGSHHAPGPDEGSEVAWSDETAEVPA
jgi:hypothetical protein